MQKYPTILPEKFLKNLKEALKMKKIFKIIGATVAGLIILLILAIIALVTFVNPNMFKGKISQVVYQQTGQQLTIAGDIGWSFFPGVAIKVDEVTLKNVGSVGELKANVKLLPLLHGEIEAGKLSLKDIKLYVEPKRSLNIPKLTVQIAMEKGVIDFDPIRASFYQGVVKGNAQVDTSGTTPQFTINGSLNNTNLQPLLKDVTGMARISGTADINIHIKTKGSDSNTILRNLDGNGKAAIKNGALQGINIPYLLKTADSLIHKTAPPQKTANSTNFGNLTGTFTIKNGLLSNKDFLMQTPEFQVTGGGTANLINQQLNYQLKAAKITEDKTKPLLVPIKVTGTFSNPKFRPDLNYAAKQAIQQKGQKVIQDVSEEITKKIGRFLR